MAVFAIDVQHRGKPTNVNDRGAVNANGISEVDVTSMLADNLDKELRKIGHSVIMGFAGNYSDRHTFVNTTNAGYYFALHMNSGINGKQDYGVIFYDYRSTKGKVIADKLATLMASRLKYPVKSVPCRPDTNGVARDTDYSEAFNCIAGVKAIGLCFEPGFLDGKIVQSLITDVHKRQGFCWDIVAAVLEMDW